MYTIKFNRAQYKSKILEIRVFNRHLMCQYLHTFYSLLYDSEIVILQINLLSRMGQQ